MPKYIDMEVKADIVVDKINQSTLTLKDGSKLSIQIPNTDTDSIGIRVENGQLQIGEGTSWSGISKGTDVVSVTGSPIVFSSSNLDSDGKLTIQHNLGKPPFGLDFTIMPNDIVFQDENTLVLDYSDQPEITNGEVWFVNSSQDMLVNASTEG